MSAIKLNLKQLRSLVKEALEEKLDESEIYIDEEGYAHDDEGNSWFVGKGQGSLHKASSYVKKFGYPRTGQSRPASSAGVSPATKAAIEDLAAKKPGDRFVDSVLSQVRSGKSLSPKQKEVLVKIMQRAGMGDAAGKL